MNIYETIMASTQKDMLLAYLETVRNQLVQLYGRTYAAAMDIAEVRKAVEAGDTFTWKGNPAAEKRLDRLLNDLASKAGTLVVDGVEKSYSLGEREADSPLLAKFGKTAQTKKEIQAICDESKKERRTAGKTAHAAAMAQTGGLNISKQGWNLSSNAKQDLELIIQNGIMEGKGARQIATGMKGYLNNPSALFRRVRDKKTGEFRLSKAAAAYHPGPGVYRSAYKNALRLARTEMTAAYRRAEWESYQNNDLVTGYTVHLSGNHTTTTTKGKPVRIHDICDTFDGKSFPKDYLWTGWHPNCRCYMTPILVSQDDFADYLEARRAKRAGKWKPTDPASRQIDALPVELTNWVKANAARLAAAKTLPGFVANIPASYNPDDSRHRLTVLDSRKEYDSYDDGKWSKEGFEANGGYLVVWSDRKPENKEKLLKQVPGKKPKKISNDYKKIYEKEYDMCKVFAAGGYRMAMLQEVPGVSSPDVWINGIPADLKRLSSGNNLERRARGAMKQGAKIVLIQFDVMNDEMATKLKQLSKMGIHGKYFITDSEKIFDF